MLAAPREIDGWRPRPRPGWPATRSRRGYGEATSRSEGCRSSRSCGSASAANCAERVESRRVETSCGDGFLAGPLEPREVGQPLVAGARHAVVEPRRERPRRPSAGRRVATGAARGTRARAGESNRRRRVAAAPGRSARAPSGRTARRCCDRRRPLVERGRRRPCLRARAGPRRSRSPSARCARTRPAVPSGPAPASRGSCMAPLQALVRARSLRPAACSSGGTSLSHSIRVGSGPKRAAPRRTAPRRRRRPRCRDRRSAARARRPGVASARRGGSPARRAAGSAARNVSRSRPRFAAFT